MLGVFVFKFRWVFAHKGQRDIDEKGYTKPMVSMVVVCKLKLIPVLPGNLQQPPGQGG